jgi:hypothetical protein
MGIQNSTAMNSEKVEGAAEPSAAAAKRLSSQKRRD